MRLAIAILLGGLLCALVADDATAEDRIDLGPPRAAKTWTWVIVLGGDCDLERAMFGDLNEAEARLRDPWWQKHVHVVALFDRAKGFDSRQGDWTTAKVFEVLPDGDWMKLGSRELADLGEVNLGDPEVLSRFVASALGAFPSERTILTLSGHGSGWRSCLPDIHAPGGAEGRDHLTADEIARGLEKGLKAVPTDRFDAITFEACLMGQLEVAYALRGVTDRVLAWQGVATGAHLAPAYIGEMEWGGTDRVGWESTIVRNARISLASESIGDGEASFTIVDTSKMDALRKALDALAVKLQTTMERDWPLYARALFQGEAYVASEDLAQGQSCIGSRDLLDILDRIRLNHGAFPAEAEAAAVEAALREAVPASRQGYQRRRSRGLSIYAPFRVGNLHDDYASSRWGKASKWASFLQDLHRRQLAAVPPPRIHSLRIVDAAGRPARAIRPLSGQRCEFAVDASDLLVVEFGVGTKFKDAGHFVQFKTQHHVTVPEERQKGLSLEQQEMLFTPYARGRVRLAQELGGVYLRLATDEGLAYATVTSSGGLVEVQGTLSHKTLGEDQGTTLFFDPETWRVASVLMRRSDEDGNHIGQSIVIPPPDAVFKPTLELITWQGKTHEVSHGEFSWGKGPRLVLDVVAPGEQALFLQATSVAGRKGVERIPFAVEADAALTLGRGRPAPRRKDVLGVWRFSTAGGGELRLRPRPEGGSGGLHWHRTDGTALVGGQGHCEIAGLPTLSLHVENRWGMPIRKAFYAILRLEGDTMVLRDLGGQETVALERVGRSEEETDAAKALVGTWTSRDGLVLTMTETTFELVLNGDRLDAGTWRVEGDRIIVKNQDGETEAVSFTLRDGVLRMKDEEGTEFTLRRAP